MKVSMSAPVLVHVAPDDEAAHKWGVYAVPRMWRARDGELVLRVNGEQDTGDESRFQQGESLYFRSADEGKTWRSCPPERDMSFLAGIESPFTRLRDGSVVSFQAETGDAIRGVTPVCEYLAPNRETLVHAYRLGDLPRGCVRLSRRRWRPGASEPEIADVTIDFPDLLLPAVCGAQYRNGKEVLVSEFAPVTERVLGERLLVGVTELPDGALACVSSGQNPKTRDRDDACVYLLESRDGGLTWRCRSLVAEGDDDHPFGFTEENSLLLAPNGDLLCLMRTEHCVVEAEEPHTGAMLAVSRDLGFTWSKAREISDSSVTPHLVDMGNGLIAAVYGRPGVHVIFSEDCGETWSEPLSVIGPTLSQVRAAGIDYMDAKYWKTSSYSNTFVAPSAPGSFAIVYNDMNYDPGDGTRRKATFVRTIFAARG